MLAAHCIYATKTKLSTKWTISCSSAVFPAMMQMVSDAQTASEAAVAAYDGIEAALGDLNTLIATVQEGPVAEVCGYTGIVNLSAADITGLVDTLNTLATTGALNSGLSTKQASSALLTAFAALSLASDKFPYATGPASLTTTPFTSIARTLLGCADGSSMRSTIGAATMVGQFDDQTGTTYQFTVDDSGKMITLTNTATVNATLPNNLPKGWNALVYQGGNGTINLSAGTGAVLVNRQNQYKTAGRYAVASLLCVSNTIGTNAMFVLGGDTQI